MLETASKEKIIEYEMSRLNFKAANVDCND